MKEELTEEMAINSAIEEEILHKFRTIITQLSPQQQEIMKMSMDGMKVKEIAKVLNVSENAIKMQKRGLIQLYAKNSESAGAFCL